MPPHESQPVQSISIAFARLQMLQQYKIFIIKPLGYYEAKNMLLT